MRKRVTAEFERRFGAAPAFLVRAPGRVNLIGEHTDDNDGFVLPMAIDRAMWIAVRPRDDGQARVHSLDYHETVRFSLADIRNESSGWGEYIKGVAWALQKAGYSLTGWEGILASDLPIGAGLSSSAALEMAAARAFASVSDLPWDATQMARIGQRAENEWVGMSCGIMDQMISSAGVEGHALLIDCRSLETRPVPLPPGVAVVVLDTSARRGLLDSAYNKRHAQCEAAARFFGVVALRDVSIEQFAAQADGLDDVVRRRADHVVTENARTLQAAQAMHQEDAVELGRLVSASHASLRDDFAASMHELDTMVACASDARSASAACFGARMMGAGFGGCAIALIRANSAHACARDVATCYRRSTGREAHNYLCAAANGPEVVPHIP